MSVIGRVNTEEFSLCIEKEEGWWAEQQFRILRLDECQDDLGCLWEGLIRALFLLGRSKMKCT